MLKQRQRPPVALLVLLACLLLSGLAAAYAGSITAGPTTTDGTPGYATSQSFGAGSESDAFPADDNNGCILCHGTNNNGPTNIALNGSVLSTGSTPTTFTVAYGSTTTFVLTFTAGSGKSAGGFLVMHNDNSSNDANGTLGKVSGDGAVHTCKGAPSGSGSTRCNGTLNSNTEATHEITKAASGGVVTFDFTYHANASAVCQTLEFGLWVNSVNNDKLCYNALDYAAFRRFRITTNCDDGNLCTTDVCNGAACNHNNNSIACNDGNACTTSDHCSGGSCGGTAVVCTASDQCHNAGSCNSSTGTCSDPAKPNGASCTDGNACTVGDTCQGGSCSSGSAVSCPTPDQCHSAGTCNPSTGVCSNPPKSGNACDDGNPCTTGETCQSGSCTGGSPIVCTALDQCHTAGTCSGGVCSNPKKGDGASCSDGNACTNGDTCQNGSCTSGTPTVCPTPDQCHTTGTCNPSTGACSNPQKADGTSCNDGKVCTTPDTCTTGVCGGPAKICNDGIACTVDSCSEAAGGCTVDTSSCGCTKDADCDDGNACNGKETCNLKTLSCQSGTAVDCSALTDACNTGTCAPSTGACSAVPKGNGTACNDGNACTTGDSCQSGKCTGTPLVCTPLDQCHSAGVCSGGVCSNPTKTGTACDDGDACTTSDTCSAGVCKGGAAKVCNDGNPCTVDGCDPSIGCTATAGNSGTVCGPASCTGGKQTAAATCSGTSLQCPSGAVTDCAPYACGATACLTVCAKDTDCATGNYCAVGGKCTPKGGPGAACTAGTQCTTSFCVDGVCCNNGCVGQCEACNLPGKAGTCSAVTGKPVAPRAACVGNGTGCDGACDGTLTTACVVPGQSKQCRAASCNAATNVATLVEFCDGSGACPSPRTQDCTPGVCGQTRCTGCSTNADCPASDFCRGGVCKPLSDDGTKCSIDVECTSGHCVDGVCCDSDCTGQCEACNQPAAPGKCLPIPGGMPPALGRPGCAGAGTLCGGVCDGVTTRACTYSGPGVPCRDADCSNGIATLVAFCDGAGSCPPPSQQTCPTGTTCNGVLCSGAANSCISDGECNRDAYCSGGVCVPKKDAGTSCNTAAECSSGICVDGYCCTQACRGQCEACDFPGSEGTCVPVTGAPHGSRQSCTGDGSVCAGSCDGATADRCAYPDSTTPCRAGSCTGGLADVAAFCQGNGSCAPLQQQSCDPYGCDLSGKRCDGPCNADADCAANEHCSAGICVERLANGSPCGSASHCTSGNCVDGVCCNSTCAGECEACDQVGNIGTCVSVVGAPRAGRPSCRGSGACGGYCDGTSGSTCQLPGADVRCGVSYCSTGVRTDAPSCNAAATCVLPSPDSCDPYQCDADGKSCLSTCAVDDDCALGLVCINGGCEQPVPDAGVVDSGVPDSSGPAGGGGTDSGATTGSGGKKGAGGAAGAMMTGEGGKPMVDGSTPVVGPDAGADAGPDSGNSPGQKSHDTGGCGCRVRGAPGGDLGAGATAIGLVLLAGARRRRPRKPARGAARA